MKSGSCQSSVEGSSTPARHCREGARLAASTGVIAAATAVSRILGFVRDLLVARLFGTGMQAQAFVVAFRLPNVLRDLVAEGAMASAVVPVLTATRATKSPEEFWRLAQALGVRLTLLVLGLGVGGALLAPWLVRVIAPGFAGDHEKFSLTVTLTRILFPFITLVGLWAFCYGLLNSLRHFAMPALGPAVWNLAMIGGCLWLAPRTTPPVVGLAWGVIIGGVLQVLIQVPVLLQRGFRPRWVWRHEGSREVMRLLGPRLAGSAVYQASVLFDTIVASLSFIVGEGAVAAFYFANRLVQLPLAVFGTASAQASLPMLSEQAAVQDVERFRATLLSVLRMVAFVMLPASAGLVVLASPIVQICFQRGAFDAASSAMTAQALRLLAVGLAAFAAGKVLINAFYALHDTATPVKLAARALLMNVALALALIWPLKLGGLALATALSSTLNAWRLLRALEVRLDRPLAASLRVPLLRMGLAAALMGVGCWALWGSVGVRLPALVALPCVIVVGALLYGMACTLLGVSELTSALRWLSRLLTAPASSSE